jgi:hypothetical protein
MLQHLKNLDKKIVDEINISYKCCNIYEICWKKPLENCWKKPPEKC